MDFMKNISRADCAFLDSLPQEEKDAFAELIIAEQARRAGFLDVEQLQTVLNLGRHAVLKLPLPWKFPRRKTSRGMRAVRSCHRDDLTAFLSDLNEAFANFDPFDERQLRASEVMDNNAPCVQLNSRVKRYRRTASMPVSTLIMEA